MIGKDWIISARKKYAIRDRHETELELAPIQLLLVTFQVLNNHGLNNLVKRGIIK